MQVRQQQEMIDRQTRERESWMQAANNRMDEIRRKSQSQPSREASPLPVSTMPNDSSVPRSGPVSAPLRSQPLNGHADSTLLPPVSSPTTDRPSVSSSTLAPTLPLSAAVDPPTSPSTPIPAHRRTTSELPGRRSWQIGSVPVLSPALPYNDTDALAARELTNQPYEMHSSV